MNLTNLGFGKSGKASRMDFGVLRVAFMVAALDGEVTDAAKELKGLIAAET